MEEIRQLKGFVDFPGGFRLLSEQPLDARYVGENLSFLESIEEAGGAYPGLKVFIKSENLFYVYKKDSEGSYKFIKDLPGSSEPGGSIEVDKEFSKDSENPVQNKVIAEKIGKIEEELTSQKPTILKCTQRSDYNLPDLSASDFNKIINNSPKSPITVSWGPEEEKAGVSVSPLRSEVSLYASPSLEVKEVTYNDNRIGNVQGYGDYIYIDLGFNTGYEWWTGVNENTPELLPEKNKILFKSQSGAYSPITLLEILPEGLAINRTVYSHSLGNSIKIKKGFSLCGRTTTRDLVFTFDDFSQIKATYQGKSEPLSVAGVRINIDGNTVHPDTIQGVGNFLYVGFGFPNGSDYWQNYDSTFIKLYNKKGEIKSINNVKTCGHGLAINHLIEKPVEPGDALVLEAGLIWGDYELKNDIIFRFMANINSPEVPEDVFGRIIVGEAMVVLPHSKDQLATYFSEIEHEVVRDYFYTEVSPEFSLVDLGVNYDSEISNLRSEIEGYYITPSSYSSVTISETGKVVKFPDFINPDEIINLAKSDKNINYIYLDEEVNSTTVTIKKHRYPVVSRTYDNNSSPYIFSWSSTSIVSFIYGEYLLTYTVVESGDVYNPPPTKTLTRTYRILGERGYDSVPTEGSIKAITSGGVFEALKEVKVKVDSGFSSESENPVQNKVITEKILDHNQSIEELRKSLNILVYGEDEV